MSTRLVILGLLKDKPLYGYELKHIIEEHMGDWTNIAFGSIYFALKKLTDEGLVAQIGEEREGNRPSRRIYEITESGRGEFRRLLEELWSSRGREYYALDIGLFFLSELQEEKRLPVIRERIAAYEALVMHLNEHERELKANPHVPPEAEAIFSHSRHHILAELAWLKEVEEAVSMGRYP